MKVTFQVQPLTQFDPSQVIISINSAMDAGEGQSTGGQTEAQIHHEQFWDKQMEGIRNLKSVSWHFIIERFI